MKKKLTTTDFIRKRQAGSPLEGEVSMAEKDMPSRSEQALRAYIEAANPRINIKKEPLRPGVAGAVRSRNPDQILLNSMMKQTPAKTEETVFHELEHSLDERGANPLGVISKSDGNPITTDNNYRFDILYNMGDKKIQDPDMKDLMDLSRAGDGKKNRLMMIHSFVKNQPLIEKFFGRSLDSAYFNPNMLKAQTRYGTEGALFAEQIADLSALEQITGKSLTRDKEMRKLLFPDDRSAEVYDAITGYRQTRLDSKDLPPYTPISPEKKGMTNWLKDKLGMKEGGEVSETPEDDYIQQMMTGTPPSDTSTNPGLLPPELRRAIDVPLDLANMAVRGTIGAVAGPAYGLYKGITSEKFGTPEGVQEAGSEAGKMMQKITGTPKTETGRDVMEFIGKQAEALKLAPTPQLLTAPLPGPGSANALLRSYELAETAPEGVIKMPGGNYLAGQVEKALKETKTLTTGAAGKSPESVLEEMKATYPPEVVKTLSPESVAQVNRAFADLEPKVALNKWIDSKLTKYVKNDMATERDPLRLQADKWATEQQPKLLAEKDAQIAKATADMERVQRERGVEPEVLTRSRARLLELEKERDFISARKGLHYDPLQTPQLYAGGVELARQNKGFSSSAVAKSEAGKLWEDVSDRFFLTDTTVGEVTEPNYFLRETDAKRIMAENPWLFKVPPETEIQLLNRGIDQEDTGFKHMTDELRNALNPDSGLPPSLQISPKDLEKMTVPQAVDLVDQINAHRAVQKREADKLAAQKSVEVYKEYPETEEGLRWVQIKLLDSGSLPEGYSISETKVPGTLAVRDADGKQVALGKNEDDAVRNFFKRNPEQLTEDLKEALRYEGDIMKHCVGGYCPDVISGESRIFSLRDNTGRPHATIEVKPTENNTPAHWLNTLPLEQQLAINDSGVKPGDFPEYQQWLDQLPGRIAQIKGLKNNKPEDKYVPYLQDFINTQKWSSIGDYRNADLVEISPEGRLFKDLREAGYDVSTISKYITKEQFEELKTVRENFLDDQTRGKLNNFAAGGEVTQFIKAHA